MVVAVKVFIATMIIILSLLSDASVFSARVGFIAVTFGNFTGPLPAQASQPSVVAVDGTLCDLTRTLAGRAVSVTCSDSSRW